MFYQPKDGHGLPHNPFKAIVSPRPIAWVSSLSAEGVANLAPFSYFNAVSDDPPILMLSFSPAPDRAAKDTLANILANGEFVVHAVPHAMRDAMNRSSAGYAAEIDEFERAGLAKAPSRMVAPPRIADAPIALECRLQLDLGLPGRDGARGAHIVFGEVIGIEIDDALLDDGRLDVTRFNPLSRLGYMDYATVFETFVMKRPDPD